MVNIFEVWPEGHFEQRIEIATKPQSKGLYAAEYRIHKEGVFVTSSRVTYGSLEAMPAKRFAIGEEAGLQLADLEQQQSSDIRGSESPHHH